ncbi:MAG: hypothetical protein GY834_09065 [Bacteroidetes bacterium]|nr:hypothetical protein [Bacteroidota bacterium]
MTTIQRLRYNTEIKMNIYKKRAGLILLLSFALTFVISSSGFSEYYKYINENGKASYTDDLSKVPADQRENLEAYESTNAVKKNTDSIVYKDEVLYYDKKTDYKIISRDGFLIGITKNDQGGEIFSEMDKYPKNLPAPGTYIDME